MRHHLPLVPFRVAGTRAFQHVRGRRIVADEGDRVSAVLAQARQIFPELRDQFEGESARRVVREING